MKTKLLLIIAISLTLSTLFLLIFVPIPEPSKRIEPPGAILEINKQIQKAVFGSYCWTIRENFFFVGMLCADMSGISTPSKPLVLTQIPTRAQIRFEIATMPDSSSMSVIPVVPGSEVYKRNDFIAWNPIGQAGWSMDQPLKSGSAYLFQGAEFVKGDGLYIIFISTNWNKPGGIFLTDAAWGSASYGFLIEVSAGK